MLDNTAKTIATVGIWVCFAVMMAFGLCRMNFGGSDGPPIFLLSMAMLCVSAVVATGIVWKQRSVPQEAARSAAERLMA